MDSAEVRRLLESTIEDIALVLGGIFAVHAVEDDVVWKVMQHLDMSHAKALARLDEADSTRRIDRQRRAAPSEPHPAIEALLRKLRLKRDG